MPGSSSRYNLLTVGWSTPQVKQSVHGTDGIGSDLVVQDAIAHQEHDALERAQVMVPWDDQAIPPIQRRHRVVVGVELDGNDELVDLAIGSIEAKIPQNRFRL